MENNGVEKSAGLTANGSPREADKALAKLVADEVVRAIEAKWGVGLAKLAIIPQLRTAANAVRRDAAYLVNKVNGEDGHDATGFETSTLKGAKRRQFHRFCELKKQNPDNTIRKCARMALDEIRDPDGYKDVDALGEYAAMHRSWWIVRAKPADCVDEGGVA